MAIKIIYIISTAIIFTFTACGVGGIDDSYSDTSYIQSNGSSNSGSSSYSNSAYSINQTSSSENSALSYLNQKREEANLQPVSENKKLHTAAKAHSIYMKSNNEISHYEDSSKYDYYESSPITRVIKAGYSYRYITEALSYGQSNYKESINSLLTAIYHRFSILSPYVDEGGAGIVDDYYTYDLSTQSNFHFYSKNGAHYIVYPNSNTKNTSPVFINNESPSPINRNFSGNPVSIEFDRTYYDCKYLTKNSFTLQDLTSSSNVAILSDKTSNNDSNFDDCQFAIFPYDRLEFGHKYKATFNYGYNSQNHTISWNFTIPKPNGEIITLNENDNITKTDTQLNHKYYIYAKPTNANYKVEYVTYRYTRGMKFSIKKYDPNTYELIITSANSGDKIKLDFNFGNYKINFYMP